MNAWFQSIRGVFLENKFAHNHLITTLSSLVGVNVFLAGLSYITTLVIANTLGREHFGELSYAIAIGGYCVTIAYCGQERTLVRDLVHLPERFDELVSASLMLRGVMLVVALVGLYGINSLVAEQNQLTFVGSLIVLAEGIRALYLSQVYDAWDEMKRHVVYFLVERCTYFTCIWVLVFFFTESLSVSAIAIFMIASIAVSFFLQYCWAVPRLNLQIDYKTMLRAMGMLRNNLWVWSAILATLTFGGMSKIVLRHVSGSAELGGYALAWQVVLLGSILISQIGRIGNLRMAKIVQPDVSQARRISFLLRYTGLSFVVGALVGFPAIFFPTVILKLFRPEYASSATTLSILGGYVIAIGIGQVATQYLISVRKEKVYSIVVIITGALSLILYSFFIPKWSAPGAALAVLLSHGTAIVIYLALMIHHVLTYYDGEFTKPR